jgi:hypothetical protein
MTKGQTMGKMLPDAMTFDIQADARWDQLVSELEAMEGRRVIVAIGPANAEERGTCSFIIELKSPEIHNEEGREAIYYQLEEAMILIYRSSIIAAEWTAGYIGIRTDSRYVTITRYVEEGIPREKPQGELVATT